MKNPAGSGLLCLAAVLALTSSLPSVIHDINSIIHSEDTDGYDIASIHALDSSTQKETGQSRQDLQNHAADLSTNERAYILQLSSGRELRMSVSRYSVDTSGATFREVTEDGETKTFDVDLEDCFFSGPLLSEEGFASLSICEGKLVGSIFTPDRDYQIHTLPHSNDVTESWDDVMQVLVTWQDKDQASDDVNDAVEVPVDSSSVEVDTRSAAGRRVTIEMCHVVDMYYLQDLHRKLGISNSSDVVQLLISKYTTVARMLSNMSQAGWDIDLRLVNVLFMRSHPDWYHAQPGELVGSRLEEVCYPSQGLHWKCDYIVLFTGRTKHPNVKGRTYQSAMCNQRYRCSAVISSDRGYMTELHEMGHSMGIKHEDIEPECHTDSDPVAGFMWGNRLHFRNCYKNILARSFSNPSKRCLHTFEYPNSSVIMDFGPDV